MSEPSADLIVGMKGIAQYLRMSEATVLKWKREYDDFPIRKNGVYIASKGQLTAWFPAYLKG